MIIWLKCGFKFNVVDFKRRHNILSISSVVNIRFNKNTLIQVPVFFTQINTKEFVLWFYYLSTFFHLRRGKNCNFWPKYLPLIFLENAKGLKWPKMPCLRIHIPCPALILDAPLLTRLQDISSISYSLVLNKCVRPHLLIFGNFSHPRTLFGPSVY